MIASPSTKVTAAPSARNTPNGTRRFFLRDSGTKIRLPSRAPRNTVSSTPFQPRKAPTMAIIFTSPPPIASSLNAHCPTRATAKSSAKPVAARSTADKNPGTPPPSDSASPSPDPDETYRQLNDRILHGDRLAEVTAPPPQQEPRDERDVVAPGDRVVAAGAGGGRREEREVVGQPQDADVEKAADAQPQHHRTAQQDRVSDHASPHRAGSPPPPRR